MRDSLATPDVDIAFAWGQLPVLVRGVIHLILLRGAVDHLVPRAAKLALVYHAVVWHALIHVVILKLAQMVLKLPPVFLLELVGEGRVFIRVASLVLLPRCGPFGLLLIWVVTHAHVRLLAAHPLPLTRAAFSWQRVLPDGLCRNSLAARSYVVKNVIR